ncbi:hypothetical protein XH96_26505 [Bradyrhizobium sp. CCBAU 51765]|nr:hypothetical protein XH96_26505 [Bradyrhizobium sp. CCBAU 51765]
MRQRSNPESLRGQILDCFAALAMTRRRLRGCRSPSSRTPSSWPPHNFFSSPRCSAGTKSPWACRRTVHPAGARFPANSQII